jgi:hypothetical protein
MSAVPMQPSQLAIGQHSETSYWDAGAWLSGSCSTRVSSLLSGVSSWNNMPGASPDGTLTRFLQEEAMWARMMNVGTLSASEGIALAILLLIFVILVRVTSKLSMGVRHIKVGRLVRFVVSIQGGDELE